MTSGGAGHYTVIMFSAAAAPPRFDECLPYVFLGQCQTHLEETKQEKYAQGIQNGK
jgi:hypothetical protein